MLTNGQMKQKVVSSQHKEVCTITEKSKSKPLSTVIILTVIIVLTVFIALVSFGSYAMASTINLPRTGQTTCYDENGNKLDCAGTGQDGDVKAGVVWPNPRFTLNGDLTITDKLTGLVWAGNAGTPTVGSCVGGEMVWKKALDYVACLNAAKYLGHGDWRLPNINELESLVNAGQSNPGQWLGTQGFTDVKPFLYWSSTTVAGLPAVARAFYMLESYMAGVGKSNGNEFWPVRAGRVGNLITPVSSVGSTVGTLI
ncbi:MAG: DUF1566 domain-containing protein [Nitrospirae bacterium]|nr:DUF1566 domain-containing protein [Nitrospirota bacterium]